MRTRKLRFLSALLAVAMMFMLTPTAAFATDATTPIDSGSITFDANGKPQTPTNAQQNVNNHYYYYPDNSANTQWVMSTDSDHVTPNGITFRPGFAFGGAGKTVINCAITVAGNLTGGIYYTTVTASKAPDPSTDYGTITDGVFQGKVNANGNSTINGGLFLGTVSPAATSTINGGVFAQDPGTTAAAKRALTASGCRIYTTSAYDAYHDIADITKVYIENAAYVVGNQEILLTVDSPTFDHWEVNGKPLSETGLTATATSDGDTQILRFTMPDDAVEVQPVVLPVKLELNADNGLPQYNGKDYMGVLALDGWQLRENTNSVYQYTLTINQGTTVDLGNHIVPWAVQNYGTLKNGIVPGNLVNVENTNTTHGPNIGQKGRVENVAFKMNVRLDQDSPISWVTLRNATACEGVFTDIVGIIGQQTLTVKPNVSEEHFKGWTYSGDVSEELAKQIDAQKDNYTMTLTLDGDAEDTLALTATTDGRLYAIDLWEGDGTASVDGTEVAAAAPGDRVTLTMDESKIPDGMTFDHWSISPEVEFAEGCKATDRTTAFIMPEQDVSVHANLRTDSDDGMDMATVVAGVAIGAGVAYLGYQVGTELYAKQILGDGVAIPRTRADVALTAWQLAGKPEVAIEGEPLSEAAMAQKWAVESGLMQNVDGSFNPDKKMSKIKALKVLDAAKKMG